MTGETIKERIYVSSQRGLAVYLEQKDRGIIHDLFDPSQMERLQGLYDGSQEVTVEDPSEKYTRIKKITVVSTKFNRWKEPCAGGSIEVEGRTRGAVMKALSELAKKCIQERPKFLRSERDDFLKSAGLMKS